jgi:Protein of unknown function (DUF1348)
MSELEPVREPLPPFTEETARLKVQKAEDAWNTRDPEKVALAYTPGGLSFSMHMFIFIGVKGVNVIYFFRLKGLTFWQTRFGEIGTNSFKDERPSKSF